MATTVWTPPGQMRHRITIQTSTEAQGSNGGVTETWTTMATVWAAAEPLSGREFFSAQQVNSEVTMRFKMRYRPGITTKMRVLFGARVFNIEAVLNLAERNRELHLMCTEVV